MKFNLKNVFLSIGIFAFTLALVGALSTNKAEALACTMTTGTWDGVAGAATNAGGTAVFSGCTGGGTTTPAVIDTLTIPDNVILTVTGNATVAGITIAATSVGANGIIINTLTNLTDSGSLAYTANSGTFNQTITIAGTGVLSVATTTTIPAPTNTGSSLLSITGSGLLTTTGALSITGGATAGNVSVAVGAGRLVASGAITITGAAGTGVAEITVAGGTVQTVGVTAITLTGSATLAKLTSTGTSTITIGGALVDTAGAVNLTGTVGIAGALTLTDGLININSGTTTVGGATTVAAGKTLTIASGATAALAALTGTTTGAVANAGTLTASGAITIGAGGTITNAGTLTASSTLAATGTVTNSGTMTLANVAASTGSLTNSGTATITTFSGTLVGLTNTGTLNLAGADAAASNITTLTATASTNTVNYTTGAQVVKQTTYYNLGFSGTGLKTVGGAITINYDLVVGSNATVALTGASTSYGLKLGSSWKTIGIWGATGATNVTMINDDYFKGAGAGTVTNTTAHSSSTTTTTDNGGDTTPPTDTSVNINAGATTTASVSATLTLAATDATQMLISNDSGFAGASWESYATSKAWTLTSGDGVKTVYAKFNDAALNTSATVSDTITVSGSGTVVVPEEHPEGCSGGNLYNVSTGALCINNAAPQGCSGGNLFNTSTGNACVNNTGNNGNPNPGLSGHGPYNFGLGTLKNGSKGEGVKELQRFLNAKLFLGLVVDGKLGPKTIAVIKKWQASHSLVADGLVGAKTKAKMHAEE